MNKRKALAAIVDIEETIKAFCPTGPGGGVDNSCSPHSDGGGSNSAGTGKVISDPDEFANLAIEHGGDKGDFIEDPGNDRWMSAEFESKQDAQQFAQAVGSEARRDGGLGGGKPIWVVNRIVPPGEPRRPYEEEEIWEDD